MAAHISGSDESPFVGGQATGSKEMKLGYDLIEDAFDDTSNIGSMTEQARIPDGGWMVRTTSKLNKLSKKKSKPIAPINPAATIFIIRFIVAPSFIRRRFQSLKLTKRLSIWVKSS